jgi:hypothetical protein
MRTIIRVFGAIAIIYCGVMAVMYLQYLFDKRDLKEASRVVYEFRPGEGQKTLLEVMAEALKTRPDDVYCETGLLSRYEGKVLVDCGEKNHFTQNQSDHYQWEVDVVAFQVLAKNPLAKKLMKNL